MSGEGLRHPKSLKKLFHSAHVAPSRHHAITTSQQLTSLEAWKKVWSSDWVGLRSREQQGACVIQYIHTYILHISFAFEVETAPGPDRSEGIAWQISPSWHSGDHTTEKRKKRKPGTHKPNQTRVPPFSVSQATHMHTILPNKIIIAYLSNTSYMILYLHNQSKTFIFIFYPRFSLIPFLSFPFLLFVPEARSLSLSY